MWRFKDNVECPKCHDVKGSKIYEGYFCSECRYLAGVCTQCGNLSTGLVLWGVYSEFPSQCTPSPEEKEILLKGARGIGNGYKFYRAPYHFSRANETTRWLFKCVECNILFPTVTRKSLEWNFTTVSSIPSIGTVDSLPSMAEVSTILDSSHTE